MTAFTMPGDPRARLDVEPAGGAGDVLITATFGRPVPVAGFLVDAGDVPDLLLAITTAAGRPNLPDIAMRAITEALETWAKSLDAAAAGPGYLPGYRQAMAAKAATVRECIGRVEQAATLTHPAPEGAPTS